MAKSSATRPIDLTSDDDLNESKSADAEVDIIRHALKTGFNNARSRSETLCGSKEHRGKWKVQTISVPLLVSERECCDPFL